MEIKTENSVSKRRCSFNEVERQTKISESSRRRCLLRRSGYEGRAKTMATERSFPKPPSLRENKEVTLAEVLDRVLDKGAVLQGDLTLKLADIDLVYVGLRLIITSVSRMEKLSSDGDFKRSCTQEEKEADLKYIQEVQKEIEKASENIPKLIDVSSPKKAERGLATLVLTLVKLLKDLMEKEAMRRIEQGNLDDLEIQKLGVTFKALDGKMEELRAVFGLKEKDLNLDLGPLGRLM